MLPVTEDAAMPSEAYLPRIDCISRGTFHSHTKFNDKISRLSSADTCRP
jgi:hypothetical protein